MGHFRSPEAHGRFTGNPDGYAPWAEWATRIAVGIAVLEKEHALSASGVPPEKLGGLVDLCSRDAESAMHVLAHDMLRNGTTWTHLALFRRLSEVAGAGLPDMSDVAGRFLPQVVRTLEWYRGLEGEPGEDVRVQTGFSRCRAMGAVGGAVEAERHADGLRILVLDEGDRGAAVTMGRGAAEDFVDRLSEMGRSRERDRKGFFTGTDGLGLSVSASNLGEPYRETLVFEVPGPDWTCHASAVLEMGDARGFAKGALALLGADPQIDRVPSPRSIR